LLLYKVCHSLAKGLCLRTQVITASKHCQNTPLGREEPTAVSEFIDLVQIEIGHEQPVTEAVKDRCVSPMANPTLKQAAVETCCHQIVGSPKRRVTSRALTTPSSWKPYPQ
jgi:hypothetical protein